MTGTRLHPPTLMPTGQVTAKLIPHPLNAWYAAAWDHEVNSMGLLARTIASTPMALYRTSDGRPVALADACWHRLAPLSMGRLVGNDEVQCPYHGLRFNSAGRCTHMPAQETINPSAMVPSYPAVERHRYVWVWLGDATQADADLIPDMHQMDDPGMGRRRPDHPCPVQLPTGPRQPDGPDARGVRARQQHRTGRAQRVRLPVTRVEDDGSVTVDAMDARRRPAAVLAQEHARSVPRLRGARRSLADHPLLGAVNDLHRRGSGRRPEPARPRETGARASTSTS